MKPEQFFPTRWILRGIPSRKVFADHLRKLPTALRKKCIYHAHYIGVYPLKPNYEKLFLEYVNNFLSVEGFAMCYNLTITDANRIIKIGRVRNEQRTNRTTNCHNP